MQHTLNVVNVVTCVNSGGGSGHYLLGNLKRCQMTILNVVFTSLHVDVLMKSHSQNNW